MTTTEKSSDRTDPRGNVTSTGASSPKGPRWVYALTGILSAVAGMAAGHLLAGLINPAFSPVLAVGSQVIDLTPTPLKEFAIRTFGTNDKLILLGSVALGTLVFAAIGGLLARRSLKLGIGALVALVAVAGLTAALRPAAGLGSVLPALLTAVVGVAVLVLLDRMIRRGWQSGRAASNGGTRRTFLMGAAGVTVGAVAAGAAGQALASRPSDSADITLPQPSDPAKALPAGLDKTYDGISPFKTPIKDFYRVDTNLTVPQVRSDSWQLKIDGMVENELTLSYQDLLSMPLVERNITMTCVSNDVGGGYIGAATWLGVPLKTLLDRVGVKGKPDQLFSTAVDGFTIGTPLEVVMDGRDAMIAVGMNGEPLTDTHGFPARMIVPGLYGFVSATKWLTNLKLTTYAEDVAYWSERDWATNAPIKTSARVDTPRPLSTIKAGRTAIGGVAWAQHRGVDKVEVRIDGGDWVRASLGPDAGVDYWRQWYLPWDAKTGLHQIAVRAVDGFGDVQTDKRARPFPNGSSGVQEIVVTVS